VTAGSEPLRFEIEGGAGATDGTPVAVLLHGRGADRHDLRGLHGRLPDGTVLVTPEAPHPGGPWGYGPGWAWYRYVADDRVVPETLDHSLHRLEEFLDGLPVRLGFQPGPVILGGFSQGGTTSLAFALTRPGRVTGVAVLSGFLVDAPEVVPVTAAALEGVPVFWGHGTHDPAIPHALGDRGRRRLQALGVELTARDYVMGHQITPVEMQDLSAWMESV
jgi:phospholipase/carboxylesterase